MQNLLVPGWYGDIYSPFRHKMEEKNRPDNPVPPLSGLCLLTEHQTPQQLPILQDENTDRFTWTSLKQSTFILTVHFILGVADAKI